MAIKAFQRHLLYSVFSLTILLRFIHKYDWPIWGSDSGEYLYLTTLFVISGFLRYLQLVFVKNDGGDPVQLFYNDSALKVIVLSWIITFGGLLYF